jgi:hypothetical protein
VIFPFLSTRLVFRWQQVWNDELALGTASSIIDCTGKELLTNAVWPVTTEALRLQRGLEQEGKKERGSAGRPHG